MTFSIGLEHAAAQLAATITFADGAAQPSRILLYTTGQPATGGDAGGSPQAEIVLAKPCATLTASGLVLHPADAGGTMVLADGIPRWGRWVRGDGLLVADGTVSDITHSGDFRLAGGATPDGDTSPMLYAGGMVLLGTLTLT